MALSGDGSKPKGILEQAHGVTQSFSGFLMRKIDSILPSPPSSSPEFSSHAVAESSSPSSMAHETPTLHTKKKTKVGDRLKKLGRDFGKFRPNSNKSSVASPRITVTEIQPRTPELGDHTTVSYATTPSALTESDDHRAIRISDTSAITTPAETDSRSLVREIEGLIETLPFPSRDNAYESITPRNLDLPTSDSSGRPIPPPYASPVRDPRLLEVLSSPDIMNGSTSRGLPSIWSLLENILPSSRGRAVEGSAQASGNGDTTNTASTDQESIFSDNSSVMVYSPLIPSNGDLVELAELVPVGLQESAAPESSPPVTGTSWQTMIWPLSWWNPTSSQSAPEASVTPQSQRPSGDTVLSPQQTSVDSAGRPVSIQAIRAWVPSRTKISVQAMWWGYRLYLPPPVLDVLSDKTLEATKRAAIITTALTWFFNNLPVYSLPSALVPAALLLQRLAPFLGYIGTFISWSWGAIKSYDVGHGVVLTATWLLPIALIPGTWHEYDFPMSPTAGAPTPLPMSPSNFSFSPSLPSTSHVMSPTSTFSPLNLGPYNPYTVHSDTSATSYLSSPVNRDDYLTGPTQSPLYARVLLEIPMSPVSEHPSSISPPPEVVPVPIGSSLMEQLLHGPIMHTVPLPEEDHPMPSSPSQTRKRGGRHR